MKVLVLIAFFITILFNPHLIESSFAANNTVVLNEIHPQPTAGADWIELYNQSSSEIDIGGWKLLDTATTTMKTMPAGTKIAPEGFLVVEVSSRLNNGGDTIKLIDQTGIELDSFKYTSSSEDKSFFRIPDGSGAWFDNQNPTKGASNGAEAPKATKPTYPKISLSEIFPNPEKGGQEWVEVYNPNTKTVDLTGWKFVDAANHRKTLSGIIATKSYKVFNYSSGWLNNTGDSVALFDPTGKQIEKVSFGSLDKKVSFAKDGSGAWRLTTIPTPGSANKISGGSIDIASNTPNEAESGSALASTGVEPILDYLTDTFTFGGGGEAVSDTDDTGKVAGLNSKGDTKNSLSILLIAAGIAFLGTAFAWPFLEKNKIV